VERTRILAILNQLRPTLQERFGVKEIALFGSMARNEATEASDVDVLVDFERPITLFELAALQQHLQQALGVSRVDVVPRDCLYPELAPSVLSGAIHA
jgi:predicted nucleotidyltransferase